MSKGLHQDWDIHEEKCRKSCGRRFSDLEDLIDVECTSQQEDPEDDGICIESRSDFEDGDEGWKILGDAQGGRVDPDFVSMNGNPGGHIQATDDAVGEVWFFQAPSKFHGDFSDSFGKLLRFDLKQSESTSQFITRDVIIETEGSLIWFQVDRNPGITFTSYSVVLDDQAGWKTDDDAEATADDIRLVLANVKELLIRGEYRRGPDVGSLDNVVLECETPPVQPPVSCGPIRSNFDGGDGEGWKVVGDPEDGNVDPDFFLTGGNPGGHIQVTDAALGGVWYFQAPPKFLGDFSTSFGQLLQFDLKQSLTSEQFDSRDVIIESTDGSLIWFDTEQNPGVSFTPYSIVLNDQAGWKTDDDTAATEAEIRNVLANIKDLLIRGEYRRGADVGFLDNVVLGVNCA